MTKDQLPGWNILLTIVLLLGVGHQNFMIGSLERSLLDSNNGLRNENRRLQEGLQALRDDFLGFSFSSGRQDDNASEAKKRTASASRFSTDVRSATDDTSTHTERSASWHSVGPSVSGGGGRMLQEDTPGHGATMVSSAQVNTPLLCSAAVDTWTLSINGTNLITYLNNEFGNVQRMLELLVGSISKTPTQVPTPFPTTSPTPSPTPSPTLSPTENCAVWQRFGKGFIKSYAAFTAAGWSTDCNSFNHDGPDTDYWDFYISGSPSGSAWVSLPSGLGSYAQVRWGNTYATQYSQISVNGGVLATSSGYDDRTTGFAFTPGDVLKLQEFGVCVVKIYSVTICRSAP